MNKTWITAAAAIGWMSLAAVPQAQSAKSAPEEKDRVTLTGCLVSADSAARGTGAATVPSRGPFVLANARVGAAPGGASGVTSAAPPGSGTSESAVKAGSTSPSAVSTGAIGSNGEPDNSDSGRYLLLGDQANLSHHVGQEVEISGRLASSATSSSRTRANRRAGTSGQAGSAANAAGASPEVQVTTVRMIASSCVVK